MWPYAYLYLHPGANRLSRIGDEVGEHLPELGREGGHRYRLRHVVRYAHVQFDRPPLHQQKNLLQHLLQVYHDWRLRFAIEAEHGAADLRDASEFLLGYAHELLRLF